MCCPNVGSRCQAGAFLTVTEKDLQDDKALRLWLIKKVNVNILTFRGAKMISESKGGEKRVQCIMGCFLSKPMSTAT